MKGFLDTTKRYLLIRAICTIILLTYGVLVLGVSCSDGGSSGGGGGGGGGYTPLPDLTAISITLSNNTVKIGGTISLPVSGTATYSDGSTRTVTVQYELKDPSTTTISLSGATVTPESVGTATIVASYTERGTEKSSEFVITVRAADAQDPESLTITANKNTLDAGEKVTLSAIVRYNTTTTEAVEAFYSVTPSGGGVMSGNVFTAGILSADTQVTIKGVFAGVEGSVTITVRRAPTDGSAGVSGNFN